MRKRTTRSRSYGSMWMSLTRSLTASEEDRVQQPDDRRLIGQVQQVLGVVEFGGDRGEILPLQLLQHFTGAAGEAGVDMVDGDQPRSGRHQHRFHRPAEQTAQFVQAPAGRRAGNGDLNRAVLPPERKDRVGPGEGQRQPCQQSRIHLRHPRSRAGKAIRRPGGAILFISSSLRSLHFMPYLLLNIHRLDLFGGVAEFRPLAVGDTSARSALSLTMRGVSRIIRLVLVRSWIWS